MVSIAAAATATPIAPIGPRPEIEFTTRTRGRARRDDRSGRCGEAGPACAQRDLHGLVLALERSSSSR